MSSPLWMPNRTIFKGSAAASVVRKQDGLSSQPPNFPTQYATPGIRHGSDRIFSAWEQRHACLGVVLRRIDS
jgi:hypothetical protein